jgi:hypothetical protein
MFKTCCGWLASSKGVLYTACFPVKLHILGRHRDGITVVHVRGVVQD